MTFYIDLAVFDLSECRLVDLHIVTNFTQSNHHFTTAVLKHIDSLQVQSFQATILLLRKLGKVLLKLDWSFNEPLNPMQAKLGLILSIADAFAKVKHGLVLANVFNLQLKMAQLMQAHLQIV